MSDNQTSTQGPIFIPLTSPVPNRNVPTRRESDQNPIFIPFDPEFSNIIPASSYPQNVSTYSRSQFNSNQEPEIRMGKLDDRRNIHIIQKGLNPIRNKIRTPKYSEPSLNDPYPYSAFPPALPIPVQPGYYREILISSTETSPSQFPASPEHNYYHETIPSLPSSPTRHPDKSSNSEERCGPIDQNEEGGSKNVRLSEPQNEIPDDQEEVENGDQNIDRSTKPPKTAKSPFLGDKSKSTTSKDSKWRGKTLDIKPPIYANRPDYDQMSPIDQARYRGQFNVLLGMLRERYPHYNIPHFADDVSLDIIHGYYESYHFHFSIRDTVDKWKIALICIWFGIELFFTKGLGLNLGGYGVNQVSMMPTYERLLYEFVEKGRGNIGAGLSPEVKILLLTVVSAVIFLIIKYISDWMGPMVGNILQNLINNLISGGPTHAGTSHVTNTINNNIPAAPTTEGSQQPPIPQVPSFLGGINIANIVQTLGGMFGRGGGGDSDNSGSQPSRRRARRRPVYDS